MNLIEKVLKEAGMVVQGADRNHKFPSLKKTAEILLATFEADYEEGGEPIFSKDGDGRFESKRDFIFWVREIHGLFKHMAMQPYIQVYRCIAAKEIDFSPYGIGESWSFDKQSAINFAKANLHRTEGKPIRLITAKVKPTNVNWENTITAYANFSDGEMTGGDENEIYIEPGTNLFDVEELPLK